MYKRQDEYFLCNINKFGAREDNQETRLTWEGSITGIFMPTQHLLSLYVQKDGTLDPRFHESFTTEWNANKNYTWDESAVHMYDKEEAVIGKALNKGDLAIKFIMPQDMDYATAVSYTHLVFLATDIRYFPTCGIRLRTDTENVFCLPSELFIQRQIPV